MPVGRRSILSITLQFERLWSPGGVVMLQANKLGDLERSLVSLDLKGMAAALLRPGCC